ncbi:MAG: restriction endonuclease subunit S [Coriobacteriia bacterium]|nr:restriction endonuclease subunit S [Coriobacteriia bacterium]
MFWSVTDAWEQRKLGDIGTVSMCRRIFKEQTSEDGCVPFFKIGTFGGQPDAYISRQLFEDYRKNYPYPKKGDLLISASGSIGKTIEYTGNDEYFQDSNIVWLRHDARLVASFLKQFYSIVKWAGLEGSTIKRLYNKTILDTNIALPDIKEQVVIGNFFHALDNLIALQQRKLEALQKLKQGYLQQLFPQEGETVPRVRFAGFCGEWESKKLGEVAGVVMGQSPDSKNYTDNPKDYILVQGNADMKNGRVTPRVWTTQVTKSANKGDLIISVRAPVGDIGKTDYDVVLGRGVAAVKGNEFIYQTLMGMKLFGYWERVSSGSTFESINSSDLKDAEILYPSHSEQVVIGLFFHTIDKQITAQSQKVKQLQRLKAAYLQRMFV